MFTNTCLSWSTLVLQLFIRNFGSHSQRFFWLCRYNNSENLRPDEFFDKRSLPFYSFFFVTKFPTFCKSCGPIGLRICVLKDHTSGDFLHCKFFSSSLWAICTSPSSRSVFDFDISGASVAVVEKRILSATFQNTLTNGQIGNGVVRFWIFVSIFTKWLLYARVFVVRY